MDFELNDEQRMLSESAARLFADRYTFDSRGAILQSADGWSRELWSAMAEMGLLGIGLPEAHGGLGGTGVETMIVAEAAGRALVVEPWLPTVVLAGGALRHGGSAAQQEARIPRIVAGEHVMALAYIEPGSPRYASDARVTQAGRAGERWTLSGRKLAVLHGGSADELVVSAHAGDGTALFLVDTGSAGVRRETVTGYDGVPVSSIEFDGADAELLGDPGDGAAVLARVLDEAAAALCAEAVGAMAETMDLTTEYLKTRQQFGVALGSFQALQHRAVDMFIQVELARSMAIHAALSLGAASDERALNVGAAKVQIGRAGRMVGQNAVQLHGAIGFTTEYKVGHLFKRLTAIDASFGDADHHLGAIARTGGLPALA